MAVNTRNGGLYWKTGLDIGGLQADAKKAKGIIGNLTSSITKQDLGAGAVLALGFAFKKVTDQAVEFSTQMETSLTEVATLSSYVTDNMDATYERIAKMATDTAQQQLSLSSAMYDVVSAGYDEADAFKVLEASAIASTAGFVDVTQAVDGVTTVLNAWGKTADDAEQVTDVFLTTVKKGKTTFGEFAQSISVVAPLAASAGISFEEIAGATASLTKQGVPTTVAMTQIRSAIIALIDNMGSGVFETRTLQEAITEFSDSMDGDFNKLKKAAGRIEGVNGILALSGEKASEASEDLKAMALSAGSVEAAFNKAVVTSENQSLILGENLKKATKPLGDLFNKMGTDITVFINEAFESGALQTFADTLKIVVPILGAYTVGVKLAKMSTLDYLISLEALQKGFLKLNKALLSNPYVIAAAAITAATIAIVKAVKNHREEVKALTTDMSELNQTMTTQSIELDGLFDTLKKSAEGSEERRKAIETINEKYKDYLPNLLNEKSSLDEIEQAYKNVSAAMSEKAIEQFRAQDIQEATEYFVKEYKDAVKDFEKKLKRTGASEIEISLGTAALNDYATKVRQLRSESETLDLSTDEGYARNAEIGREILEARAQLSEKYGISLAEISKSESKINYLYKEQQSTIQNINREYNGLIEGLKAGNAEIDNINTGEKTDEQKGEKTDEQIAAENEKFEKQLKKQQKDFEDFNNYKSILTKEQLADQYELQQEYGGDYEKFLKDQLEKNKDNIEKQKIIIDAAKASGVDFGNDKGSFEKQLKENAEAFENYNNYKTTLSEQQLDQEYKLQKQYSGNYKKYLLDLLKEYEGDVEKQKAIIDAAVKEGVDFNREEVVNDEDLTKKLEKLRNKYLNAKTAIEQESIKIEMEIVAEKLNVTDIEFSAKTASEKIIAINNHIDTLQKQGIEANTQAEKKSIEDQITYWRWRATEVLDVLDQEKELMTDVHELTYSQIRKQIALIKDKIATEKLSAAEIEKWESRLKALNAEGMVALIYSGGQFLGIANKINDTFKEITGETNEAVDNILDEAGALAKFASGMISLDIGDVVEGALEHLKTMTRISEERQTQNARDARALEQWIQTVGFYQDQLETLEDLLNKSATDFERVRNLAGYWRDIGNGIKIYVTGALEQAADAAELYRQTLIKALEVELGVSQSEWEKYGYTIESIISMLEQEGRLTPEIESIIEGWENATESAEDYERQLKEILTGTTASQLSDEMFRMFQEGRVAVEDFAEFFEDTMNNAIVEVFKRSFIEQQMVEWYEAFAEAMADGIITDEERVDLRELGNQIAADAAAAWDEIQSILPGFEQEEQEETLTGEIQRSITEETASIIAGTMNGILASTIQIRESMSDILGYQQKIEKNTYRSAEKLDQIYNQMTTNANENGTNTGLI
jgi:TP901 family phage tail tape measure protein